MNAAASIRDALRAPVAATPEPMRLAECFRRSRFEQGGTPTLVRWARAWWRFDGVRYVEHDDEALNRDINHFLDVVVVERKNEDGQTTKERITARTRTTNEVRNALTTTFPMVMGGAPQWTIKGESDAAPERLLPCANGLLDVRTRELCDPTPRLFATTAIGTRWDPHAASPKRWLGFLKSLWGDDAESIASLQQIFGYLLMPDTSQQKIFALVGPKRSGKSTIGRVLTALLGDAVVHPTLGSLERPFGLAPLVGKTLAVIGDARLGGRSDQAAVVERLLSISGEDSISIDRKNRDAINVRLRTRVLLISNELPRLYDTSGALASRFLILTTARSFLGEEDMLLERELMAELPGIFRWAVDGYEDLAERGRFTVPAASLEAIEELEALSSPLIVFIRECCRVEPGLEIEQGALYDNYKNWCKENGREPSSKQEFGRNLNAVNPAIGKSQRRRPLGGWPGKSPADGPAARWFYRGIGNA